MFSQDQAKVSFKSKSTKTLTVSVWFLAHRIIYSLSIENSLWTLSEIYWRNLRWKVRMKYGLKCETSSTNNQFSSRKNFSLQSVKNYHKLILERAIFHIFILLKFSSIKLPRVLIFRFPSSWFMHNFPIFDADNVANSFIRLG